MDEKIKKMLLEATASTKGATRYEIIDPRVKSIISLWLILKDLEEMIDCIERAKKVQLINNIDQLIPKSLWEKMVISYGKIFSQSDDGFSKIESKHYFTSKRSLGIHEKLIKVRNSYLAHRGYNDYEHCLMTMDLVPKNGRVKLEFAFPTAKQIDYFNKDYGLILSHLKMLKRKVKGKLNEKVIKLERLIIDLLTESKSVNS
jgi:hypothetical protein